MGAGRTAPGDTFGIGIIITAQGKIYWIDLGDFGYGDPLLDFRIMEHMSLLAPNPFLKHIYIPAKAIENYEIINSYLTFS